MANSADGAYNAGYYWCYYYEVPANKESVAVTRGNLAKNTYWSEYGRSVVVKPTNWYDSMQPKAIKKNGVVLSDFYAKILKRDDWVTLGAM